MLSGTNAPVVPDILVFACGCRSPLPILACLSFWLLQLRHYADLDTIFYYG